MSQEQLSYRLVPGDVYLVKQEAQQVITQRLAESEHRITNNISGVMEFKVLARMDSGFELAMVFKDLTMNMDSNTHGELLNVDAKQVIEGDTQSRIFNSLLNVPIRIELAKDGKVLNVVGGDSLVRRMVDASGLDDAFTLELMAKSLEAEFGSQALSDSYEQMTYFYPSQPIAVGDTWVNEYSGKLSATNTWTLQSLDAQTANITGIAQVAIEMEEPSTTMILNGIQNTSIITDRISGFITHMIVESTTEGFSTLSQLSDQEIPTTIRSSITYQLIQ